MENSEKTYELYRNFYSSNRLLIDYGDEKDCDNNKQSYMLIKIVFQHLNETSSEEEDQKYSLLDRKALKEFINFIQRNHTYIGFCFFKQCNHTLHELLDFNLNPKLNDRIKQITGFQPILNSTLYRKFEESQYPMADFIVFFSIMGLYCLVKIAFIIYSFTDPRIRKELIINPYSESLLTDYNPRRKARLQSTEIIKYFSIKHMMEIVSCDTDYYFSDGKLIFLHLIRFVILQFLNFYNSFLTFYANPKINEDSFTLLKGITFNIIKLSYFIANTLYFISGIFFAYKLLGLIFKYRSASFKNFLYFYLLVMIRIIPVSLLIYMIYAFGNEFIYFFSSRPLLSKTVFTELYDSNESRMVKSGILNNKFYFPFYYIYENLSTWPENRIQPYLQIVYWCFNEFYLFTISCILFYFLFKLRNKLFDIFFFFATFFLLLVKIFYNFDEDSLSKNPENPHQLSLNFFQIIYNLNSIGKFDHAYLTYFIGNMVGIVYFDYLILDPKVFEILNRDFKGYFPFIFFANISKFINNYLGDKKIKTIIMSVLWCISIILALILTFNYSNNLFFPRDQILLPLNSFTKLISIYEIIIFVSLLALFLYACMFMFKVTEVRGKKLIFLVSRSFYIFIPLSHIMNYYVMVFFQIDMDMYFSNILFFHFASFLIIYLIALANLLLFEIPLRILFKRKIKRLFYEKKEKNF